jgi:hypothetical protein
VQALLARELVATSEIALPVGTWCNGIDGQGWTSIRTRSGVIVLTESRAVRNGGLRLI